MQTELVLVETISSFRHRFVIEVPKGKSEWALDDVTMNTEGDLKELSQHHLGETIVSHRVVNPEEVIRISRQDNYYLKSWSDDDHLDRLVNWSKDLDQNECL